MKNIGTIILSILMFSCLDKKDEDYIKYFNMILTEIPNSDGDYIAYFIVPVTTCIGCKGHVYENVFNSLRNNYPIKVIIECSPSKYGRLTEVLYEESLLDHSNIHIDTLMKYQLPITSDYSQLPTIINLSNDSILNVEFLCAKTPNVINDLMLKAKPIDIND
jgi:hypothetical protein